MSDRNINLYDVFRTRFPAPQRPFLEQPDGTIHTYGDLQHESARIANALRSLGVEPGDRVAVQVQKSPRALFLYLACLRAGFVYLPLNTAYPPRELDYFVSDAGPGAIVCGPQLLEAVEAIASRHGVANVLTMDAAGEGTLAAAAADCAHDFDTVPRADDDLAAILYTSGTTGQPKGAMLTQRNLRSNAEVLHEVWGFEPGDVLLHALPLFHTHGLFVACHCVLMNGSAMNLLPRFDVDAVLRALPRSSVFMGVPTFYTRLLADERFGPQHCAGMRLFISGSAPLLAQTHEAFEQRTGHVVLERYGMTECGMSTSNPLRGQRKAGTVGPPLPGVSLRVVGEDGRALGPGEVGGVEFVGPNVFRGYWRKPEKTAEAFTGDGYFRSGDLGMWDDDGYLSIVGRSKDLIISGGFNVYPKEVELCIDELEAVAESAVIGLPDPDFGERVVAVVVPNGERQMDPAEVTAALKTMLAGYKVPKQLEFIEELPRNAMGKVQKNLLREKYAPP
ncbi:MAG: malonate--CoA ligase [Gammaproteobacteria bacterium]